MITALNRINSDSGSIGQALNRELTSGVVEDCYVGRVTMEILSVAEKSCLVVQVLHWT